MTEPAKRVLLVVNMRHESAPLMAKDVATRLLDAQVDVVVAEPDIGDWYTGSSVVPADEHAADGCDAVVVLGGDGTLLRAAELARSSGAPLVGVNLGHVGFLAESEPEDLDFVIDAVVHRRWQVEERLALDVEVTNGGNVTARTWALNEVSVEKLARERMIELVVEVDGRPLSRWGCDGAVCATPTGSTAYAFSAGGPVLWPEVSAMVVVPLSAHALFARPLVVAPSSVIAFESQVGSPAVLWADGRRTIDVPAGSRIEVRQHAQPVCLARLVDAPFTDRLVAKFALPVEGWRGQRA
jgi:NAD+ kinase